MKEKIINHEKGRIFNPSSIKDINSNLSNLYDTSFKSRKTLKDGFNLITKIKRNFK